MASSYSPALRLELMATGDQTGNWGNTTNTNLGTLIESAIAGYATVSVTSANQALTANNGISDQARSFMLKLTTTTTAPFAVYAPPTNKAYIVANSTAYAATMYNSSIIGNTTAAGAGVTVPAGATMVIITDGTNFSSGVNVLSGTLGVPAGGTGATTLSAGSILVGNGTSAIGAATAAQIVAAIGATPVANATAAATATSATTATTATSATTATTATTASNIAGGTGGQLPYQSGAGVTALLANGSAGQVLQSAGGTNPPVWAAPAVGGFSNIAAFTSSGTFTIPAGITKLKVTVTGGGGGGGTGVNSGNILFGGSGGGAGGTAIQVFSGLTPGGTLTVTIPSAAAAGVAATATTLSSGTQTIATVTGNGGGAGANNTYGGVGGSATGGTVNINGGRGSPGIQSSNTNATAGGGGNGGASFWGGGGAGAPGTTAAGQAGDALGSGGGGGNGTAAGGAGTTGFILIEY